MKSADTTDVQVVRAIQLENDNSLMLQCMFVNGSDAIGCLVALHSLSEGDSTTVKSTREGMHMYAMKVVKLTKSTVCVYESFGYDTESNGSVGTLAVSGELFRNVSVLPNCSSSGTVQENIPSKYLLLDCTLSIIDLL